LARLRAFDSAVIQGTIRAFLCIIQVPQIEYPTIFKLTDKTYFHDDDSKYQKYFEKFIYECNEKIEDIARSKSMLSAAEIEDAAIQWVIPRDKAMRGIQLDKCAGLESALRWSALSGNSVEAKDRKSLAIIVLGDIQDERASNKLAQIAEGDPNPFNRIIALQALFGSGRERFVQIYEKLLNDDYQDINSHAYPVRETAASLLMQMGIYVEVRNGNYRIKK